MSNKSPCYKYEERHEGCHCHCEKYLEFARIARETRERIQKIKYHEAQYDALAIRRNRRG